MKISEFLKQEFLRPIIMYFIPGVAAIWPYVWLLLLYDFRTPERFINSFVDKNVGVAGLIICIAAFALGMILENIGSTCEVLWDKLIVLFNREHLDDWHSYLQLNLDPEPIGQIYLNTLVTRLKFVLGMGVAMLVAAGGIFWLRAHNPPHPTSDVLYYLALFHVAVAIYLLCIDVPSIAIVLSETRKLLIARFAVAPQATAPGSRTALLILLDTQLDGAKDTASKLRNAI